MLKQITFNRLLAACIFLWLHSPLPAQRKLNFLSSSPVSTISAETIQTYKGDGITELIRSLPQTHIVTQRNSTIELRGLGSNQSLVLINGRRQTLYGQSVTYDVNNIPVEAIERIEVLKDGSGAIYGPDAISGVVNIITKKDMDLRFNSGTTYQPYYTLPRISYEGYTNDQYNQWTGQVKDIYSLSTGLSSKADMTYGQNGKMDMDLQIRADYRIQDIKLKDDRGVIRQSVRYEWYPENYRYGETYFYDCKGKMLQYKAEFTDVNGYDFEIKQTAYENNLTKVEYRDLFPLSAGGNSFRINLNPAVNVNEPLNNYWTQYRFEMPAGDCEKKTNSSCSPNIIYGGFSLMLEDFGNGDNLTMPGGFLNYTRMICENFGVTGHLAFNTGKEGMVDYTKLGVFAGVSWTPFREANCNDPFIFTTQALLGLVSQSQKYGSMKYTDNYLGGMFGLTQAYQVSDRIAIRASEHYSPVFANGNTANNFVLGLGIRVNF